ncbi:anti-anti-sigma regulatory factor, SpoIIAA [Lachnospiraceae bacterium XBB1006]|nr:anti-anti-sigma regulatory factor, SpoIIAA [Lachnospiraceae bacterium XBB1006]
MEAEYQVDEQFLFIYIPQEVDHHVADKIRRETDVLLSERSIRKIVFDFHDTRFMDSSGIGMILGRVKKMRKCGGSVEAVGVSNQVARIFDMAGLPSVMTMRQKEECV